MTPPVTQAAVSVRFPASQDAKAAKVKGRIAFLLSSLKFGGGERVALNLATALHAEGYVIDFVLMSREGEYLSEAESKFNVVDLRCDRTWKLPIKLARYLLRRKPKGLISSFWKLNLCACLARLARSNTKLLLWEHSPPSKSTNSPTKLYAISTSIIYRLGSKVICVSSGVYDDIARITLGLSGRMQVIFNPITPPAGLLPATHRQGGGRQLIWVGRLDVPKNPALMLEAFALLPSSAGWRINFVGDGPLRHTLEQRADFLGVRDRVRFVGFQTNPYALMAESDLLVLSSDREGLGTVLIEALYCGLTVVSTDCGQGIHDIILDNRYGAIVPLGNATALAQAIEMKCGQPNAPAHQIQGAQRFLPNAIVGQFLQAMGLAGSE